MYYLHDFMITINKRRLITCSTYKQNPSFFYSKTYIKSTSTVHKINSKSGFISNIASLLLN